MGHTRRFCTQPALTKVYRVKQPPTSSYPTCDDEMVPFGLAHAPKAFQKMVISFQKLDSQLQSQNQDGSQEEEFFDAVDEFQVDHPTRL